MTAKYARHVAKRGPTAQTQPIPGREREMVKNSAGGFVFQTGDWERLDRFLILGSEGNTYYATEQKLTVENAQCIQRCLKEDGLRTVARIVHISDAGRAPKNEPALFALALAAADPNEATRQYAMAALPKVARIGTHLFHFAEMVQAQRGWGRALRRAVGDWYNNMPLPKLVQQVMKYQQRDGWSNRDLLRLSHPKTDEAGRKAVYDWACGRKGGEVHPALAAMDALALTPTAEAAVEAIHGYGLPRECIPTELLNDVDVWAALLEEMPLHAMVRNLGKMSAIGLLKPLGKDNAKVIEELGDPHFLRKSRLHPFAILLALKTYGSGRGIKGSLSWTPVQQIVDALDDAFYKAFDYVEPTGKRILIGLDVSGSMSSPLMNSPLQVCEGAAAMAMTFARTEKEYHIFAFNNRFQKLNITAKSTMAQVLKQTKDINGGGTDCALPMVYALEHSLEVDAFITITDNETWSGGGGYFSGRSSGHPVQALERYRQATGIPAKNIVVGMTSTGFTVADPKDNLSLDVVGFDAASPQIISDFIRG